MTEIFGKLPAALVADGILQCRSRFEAGKIGLLDLALRKIDFCPNLIGDNEAEVFVMLNRLPSPSARDILQR